jgi:hypothetical protein
MIETKVVEIISETTVVLSAGSDQQVQEGDWFAIYELSKEIMDPETGESLGRLEYVKGKVQVKNVMKKMSYACTNAHKETRFRSTMPLNPAVDFFKVPYQATVGETLKVKEEDKNSDLIPKDLYVRIGDLAKSIDPPVQ